MNYLVRLRMIDYQNTKVAMIICESWIFVAGCCQRTLVGRVYIILWSKFQDKVSENTGHTIKAILYK